MAAHSHHSVDDAALEHLERLARLVIEPSERGALKHDLVELLEFVDSLSEVDVSSLESDAAGTVAAPASDPAPSSTAERPDELRPSLPTSRAVAMAPEAQDGFFKVPRTVEEG